MKNYLDEAIFTEYIRNVFAEKGIIAIEVTLLSEDNIEPKFKVDRAGGTYFAKYSSYNKFSKKFFEMKGLERLNESVCYRLYQKISRISINS